MLRANPGICIRHMHAKDPFCMSQTNSISETSVKSPIEDLMAVEYRPQLAVLVLVLVLSPLHTVVL
ncbi:hypothetical protein AAE478_007335 [Parahypoxylon ruwenzoriense]